MDKMEQKELKRQVERQKEIIDYQRETIDEILKQRQMLIKLLLASSQEDIDIGSKTQEIIEVFDQ